MNGVMKGMFLVFVVLYILSPADLAPGPIDDLLMLAMGIGTFKNFSRLED